MKLFPAPGLVLCAACVALGSSVLLFMPTITPAVGLVWVLLLVPVVVDGFWLRARRGQVTAMVTVASSCVRGDEVPVNLEVVNDGDKMLRTLVRPILPDQGVPRLIVARATVPPRSSGTFTIPLKTPVRGAYRFGDVYIRLLGPCRMMFGQVRVPVERQCRVYPDVRSVKEHIITRRLHSMLVPHLQTARLRGIGSEFESLRDFEEGDDIRRIDWKATARQGRPISRNYEIEHLRDVMLVVDRGRLMAGKAGEGTKLDHALDAALMLGGVALDCGDRCGLLVFDQEVQAYLPPRGGMSQLQSLIETLYDVQPTLTESHFRRAFMHLQTRLTKRSLVLVLSDVLDPDSSSAVIAGLISLSRRHLVVLAALRTPEIEGVLVEPVDDDQRPFRKAVAYRLIRERAEVMARLQKAGIHILDVRPEELTLPVVNKYLELREANLL